MGSSPMIFLVEWSRSPYFAPGEMAERSIAAVLKTVEGQTSGGSNPSLSAKHEQNSAQPFGWAFFMTRTRAELARVSGRGIKKAARSAALFCLCLVLPVRGSPSGAR